MHGKELNRFIETPNIKNPNVHTIIKPFKLYNFGMLYQYSMTCKSRPQFPAGLLLPGAKNIDDIPK